MAQQIQTQADPTANASQGGVNLPSGITSIQRLSSAGSVWIVKFSSTYALATVNKLVGHIPCGDLVVVIGTDATHGVQIGSNGLAETVW